MTSTTQMTILKRCGPCPRLREFNPGICLTTEEKHGKTSVRVVKECCYPPYPHSHYYISLTHPYSTKPTHTHPHTLQYYHTITIPTISTPTILHKPHTSIKYKTHTHTPPHITILPHHNKNTPFFIWNPAVSYHVRNKMAPILQHAKPVTLCQRICLIRGLEL